MCSIGALPLAVSSYVNNSTDTGIFASPSFATVSSIESPSFTVVELAFKLTSTTAKKKTNVHVYSMCMSGNMMIVV